MDIERLHWTESNIECITVRGRNIEVIASGVFFPRDPVPKKVRVLFIDVQRTERVVTEYIGDSLKPKGFKEPYTVRDLETAQLSATTREFGLEGITTFEPIAWIDWTVEAANCQVYAL
jgi:hypothetical protein